MEPKPAQDPTQSTAIPEPVATGSVIEQELSHQLHRAFRRMRQDWSTHLEPWGLTPFQWRALRVILHNGGSARPGVIAEHLGIAPRSATEVIDQLEQKGLALRKPDAQDRRATQVHLTSEGHQLSKQIQSQRKQLADQFFAVLSPTERTLLLELLQKLNLTEP